MSVIVFMIFLSLASCTIYVRPITKKNPPIHHAASKSRRSSSHHVNGTTLVDSNWIASYKKMEREHGNYTIPQDSQVIPIGDKFRVPKAMSDHFQDMSRAFIPVPSTSP